MENKEITRLLEKNEYYYNVMQTYVYQLRNLKAVTFEYTDEVKSKMSDIDAKIRILREYLIEYNNRMLDMKYNGELMSDAQKKQIDHFLFKCCSN